MVWCQLNLAKRVKLIDTLKEVRMQEPDSSFLAPEYVEILEHEEQIQRELKEQPGRLQFLHGIIVDLFVRRAARPAHTRRAPSVLRRRQARRSRRPAGFAQVDNAKFKGQNVTQHVPQLQRVLNDYNIDALLGFFTR